MMNWRDLMAPPPGVLTHPHNPHNPQNGGSRGSSADIADIADEVVAEKSPVFDPQTKTGEASPLPLPPLPPAPQPGWLGVEAPAPPLQPGWLVAYRDRRGTLCGGCDDRTHGTVQECRWAEKGWTVHLTDGQQMPLYLIRSVGRTESTGQVVAAWTVREHGYDGEGPLG